MVFLKIVTLAEGVSAGLFLAVYNNNKYTCRASRHVRGDNLVNIS